MVSATHALFDFMKEVEDLDDLATRSIPIRADDSDAVDGYLLPVGQLHVQDPDFARLLGEWRDKHQYAYPTRFLVTQEGTQRWLRDSVLNNPDRLLFLICDGLLRTVGHVGVLLKEDETLELDNVLRGAGESRGLMRRACAALEQWVSTELLIERLSLRVLESNSRAVKFYESQDYVVELREPLGWTESDTGVKVLQPSTTCVDDTFLTMSKALQQNAPASPKILTAGPQIGVREATFTLDATRRGWNENHSDYLQRFEQEFAEFIGVKHALATSSCTGALHLALVAAGVGPGDEVVVPEITWVATGSAVAYTGATPVFVDVDPDSWTLNVESFERAITANTRAVVPVHLYGFPCDVSEIVRIARDFGVVVIEDAAPAIGATYNDRLVGSFGDFGCFSFQGAKMLVTGEGGMLTTNDSDLYARVKKLQEHGRVPGTFWIDTLGFKYKMSNLTASLGLAQLHSASVQIAKKRRIHTWYRDLLSGVSGISLQEPVPDTNPIYWMTSIAVDPDSGRDASGLAEMLHDHGIDTRPVFPAMSTFPIWQDSRSTAGTNSHAARVSLGGLNLPSGVGLSIRDVEKVASVIGKFFDDE